MSIDRARMPTREEIAETIAQRDGAYANCEDYLEDADRILALLGGKGMSVGPKTPREANLRNEVARLGAENRYLREEKGKSLIEAREALAKAEAKLRCPIGLDDSPTICSVGSCYTCVDLRAVSCTALAVSAEALLAEAGEVLGPFAYPMDHSRGFLMTDHAHRARAFIAKLKQREGSNG